MNAIVAVCKDWGIGYKGKLLVNNPSDMRHFVELTSSGTVVMGRATYDSLPGKRPLKNRRNIVLTRNPDFSVEGFEVVRNIDELMSAVVHEDPSAVWCIGGASVYELLLDCCDACYVTHHDCVRPADTFFPNLAVHPEWKLVETSHEGTTNEGIPFRFCTWKRV